MGKAVALLGALLTTSVLAAPASAQVRPPPEGAEAPALDVAESPMLSAATLERIRLALAVERPISLPRGEDLGFRNDGPFTDRRPVVQLFGSLDLVGTIDRFGAGPTMIGPPTHSDMMRAMTPRWFTEGRPSGDLLGVATGSAFALLPAAIKALGGWMFSDDDTGPEHPILTESEESLALAHVRADGRVLDADVQQHGRTVILSLVVPPDTPPDLVHTLGERFLVLVKTFSSAEPQPDREVGIGDYDYIVRVSSPTEIAMALGGKAAAGTTINWSL